MNTTFQNPAVRDNSNQVLQFLKFIEKDASYSHDLANMGINTQLAQSISNYFSNPLNALGENYLSVSENLKRILEVIVKQFLKSNKEIVAKAYSAPGSFLEYYIILKNDTSKNRQVFFNFLRQYELLGIDDSLPIHFSFLPKKAVSVMDTAKEIVLAKG
jgi:hypothetical protein